MNNVLSKITLYFLLILSVYSLNCGGNCPSNTCIDCWCGETKNIVNIADQCKKYNWDQRCCQCIMSKQSGGNSNAMYRGNNNFVYKTGLWQLSENGRKLICKLDKQDKSVLCNKDINMDCAYKFYKVLMQGHGWYQWEQSARQCNCIPKLNSQNTELNETFKNQ